jgi:hypothetical protein
VLCVFAVRCANSEKIASHQIISSIGWDEFVGAKVPSKSSSTNTSSKLTQSGIRSSSFVGSYVLLTLVVGREREREREMRQGDRYLELRCSISIYYTRNYKFVCECGM